jgi:hypothetical protein
MWVFDDARVGLVQEPFVSGADTVIDLMVEGIPGADKGFSMVFAAIPFPGHQHEFRLGRAEAGGHWYSAPGMEGWLCPALLKYFDKPPERLNVQVRARSGRVAATKKGAPGGPLRITRSSAGP